jgi:DNA-binding transcriptional LysR family regulator
MNLRSIDLNLLVILQALLEERHVTRAARRLALSQPATSNALDRCRLVFDDPLLERVAGEMRLTSKAQALIEPLAQALIAVSSVVDAPKMELAQIGQTVRLVMADQPGLAVMTGLLSRLNESAPNVDVVLLPWRSSNDALYRLEGGEADIAISVFPALPPQFHRVELMRERYAVAMQSNHPAAKSFCLERWLEWPHLVVSGEGSKRGSLEEVLARHGLSRRVGAVVPNFMMVEPLLLASNLIGMVPPSCLSRGKHLAVFEPALAIEDFNLHLAWHTRRDMDPVVQHVVELLRDQFESHEVVTKTKKGFF